MMTAQSNWTNGTKGLDAEGLLCNLYNNYT